jgi:endonuclease YncB( thermonuclease family)
LTRGARDLAGFGERNRRRPWRTRVARGAARPDLPAAAFWSIAFVGLTGGYAVLAPVVDDWRSGLREMTADCRVVRVIDGDTVDLACAGRGAVRARIVGYDSPELFSPGCDAERAAAEEARRVLENWVRRSAGTEVAFLGSDRYDRRLVDMRLSGQRVATAMVEAGNGRRYFGSLRGGWC